MNLDQRSLYLRSLVLRAMKAGKRGHWGSSASLIEIMRVLYDDVAKYDPKNPKLVGRDRIILSKGHGVLAQAVLLADKGFFPPEWLDGFCQKDAHIGGHPSPDHMPGVECHTGALGHGLSIGVGMAIAAKIRKQPHRIFVVCGDGELNEGSIWEACLSAAKHKLDNLMLIIDHNKLQSAGFVDDIQPLGNLRAKFQSFGFDVAECDGHTLEDLRVCIRGMPDLVGIGIPLCVIAHTTKGRGISFAENNPSFHYKGAIDEKLMTEMEEALGYVA